MALKTEVVTIDNEESRDFGKQFLVSEMPADKAEKWAARALNALAASGIELPDSAASAGIRGLALAGMAGLKNFHGLPWKEVEPLLDEMMSCVMVIPDQDKQTRNRPLRNTDTEEMSTRLLLRNVWLELTMGFSFTAKSSTSGSAVDAEAPLSTSTSALHT